MSTFKKTAIVTLALASFTASTLTADAGRRERNLALGIVGGLVAGAAIAGARNRAYDDDYYAPRPIYRSRYERHVNWCYNRYASYRERSNTWISRSNRVRNCNSPYGS